MTMSRNTVLREGFNCDCAAALAIHDRLDHANIGRGMQPESLDEPAPLCRRFVLAGYTSPPTCGYFRCASAERSLPRWQKELARVAARNGYVLLFRADRTGWSNARARLDRNSSGFIAAGSGGPGFEVGRAIGEIAQPLALGVARRYRTARRGGVCLLLCSGGMASCSVCSPALAPPIVRSIPTDSVIHSRVHSISSQSARWLGEPSMTILEQSSGRRKWPPLSVAAMVVSA